MDDLDVSRLESMRRVLNGVLARINQYGLVRKLGGGRAAAALAAALAAGGVLLW